jgi:hypothetical protein
MTEYQRLHLMEQIEVDIHNARTANHNHAPQTTERWLLCALHNLYTLMDRTAADHGPLTPAEQEELWTPRAKH